MLPTLGFPPDRGAFTLPSLERFHNIHPFLELPAFTSLNYKFFNPLNVIIEYYMLGGLLNCLDKLRDCMYTQTHDIMLQIALEAPYCSITEG